MKFNKIIEKLEQNNIQYLIESGSPQKLRHYTDIKGLLFILKDGYIRQMPYYYGGSGISVVRPSLTNTLDFNDKKYVGYFEIDFHILNDLVKNIKKEPLNELSIEYTTRLENIGKKYNIAKNVLLQIYDLVENDENNFIEKVKSRFGVQLSKIDAIEFIKNYYNLIFSLYYREGEERIKGNSIPLSDKYIRFYFLKCFDDEFNSLSKKTQIELKSRMKDYKNIF